MPQKTKTTQATKAIRQRKTQVKPKKPSPSNRLVVAPTTRAVQARVPASLNRKQELVLPVRKTAQTGGDMAQEFVLHPSNIPWLKNIAPSFQRWGLQNLKVWYEPRVSSSTNGTIGMAIISDFKDATPTSLQSLTSVKGSVRGAPWDKFTLSCPKYRTYEFVNDFPTLSSEDKNERALARIVAVADMDKEFGEGDLVGRIFIEYTPVLVDPIDPLLQVGNVA